ncbi:MAG: ABC transporter substrate-binding protein [Candidatus Eremiobacteraeota bacterium]|nr:ABC transporter substrate-binding protein [Candidatus Eremiobacteraeota bacterium]
MNLQRILRALRAGLCSAVLLASPASARDDVLRIGQTTEPNSLSPLLALNDYEQFVDRLMFDVLVTVDASGRTLLPRLAAQVPTLQNGGISKDGLTLTYRLRRNVTWHDGAPFTSADVRFSYDAVMNPANNVPNRHGYDMVRSVATPDAYTVVFHMKRPYAPAVTNLFSDAAPNPILPRHLLAQFPNLNRVPFNQAPIGTGPYKFLRWDHGQSVEVVANDRYYLGKPKIERVSVRFVPDETTIINQLRTHELDVFSQASVNAFGQIRTVPGLKFALVNFHGASNVLINTSRPDLRDVRVRRAIASAIDKRAIVERFTYGAGKVASADLPEFMWAHDPHSSAPGYDPSLARRLLAQAGWKPGPGGLVEKNGRPLTLVFAFAQNNAAARLISVQLQSYLRAVGLDVQLKGYNAAMMFAGMAAGGIYQTGNFDLAWYTMSLGIDPDSSGRFMCDAIPPNGQNYSRYCSKAMDAAQTAGLEHVDRAARQRAYAKSERLLIYDVPIVFVYWPMTIDAFDPRLRGFAPNPVTDAWNAHEWAWL